MTVFSRKNYYLQKLRNCKSRIFSLLISCFSGARKWRPQWLSLYVALSPEDKVHAHSKEERASLFLSVNGGTTEMEVLNWIYATILVLKPENIIETGAADGFGTIALASACKANGFGRVHSIEIDEEVCKKARRRLEKAGLSDYATYYNTDSLKFIKTTKTVFQLGFFDSVCEIRPEECSLCHERKILNGPSIFHDTSAFRTESMPNWPNAQVHNAYREKIKECASKYYDNQIFESNLSRGFIVLWPKKWPIK